MKLQVKEGDLSTETLEDILDIFVRVKTTGTHLRVETKLVTALIRELLRLKKDTCPIEVQEFFPSEPDGPSSKEEKASQQDPETKLITIEGQPAIIAEEPTTTPKKPLLRKMLSTHSKEKISPRFWIIFGLVLFNVSWITVLITFLF